MSCRRPDKTSLQQFYESLRALAEEEKQHIVIVGQNDIEFNVKKVILETGPQEKITTAGLPDNIVITWTKNAEGWCYAKDMTAPFLTADESDCCEQNLETDEYFIEIEWKPQ